MNFAFMLTYVALPSTVAMSPLTAEGSASLMALQTQAQPSEDVEDVDVVYVDAATPATPVDPRIAPEQDKERRDYVRLRWDMVPLSYTYGYGWDDPDVAGENDHRSHTVTAFGGPSIQSGGALRSGLGLSSGLGMSLGYVWDDQLALGARFGFGWQFRTDDDSDRTTNILTYSVTPEIDYLFRPGERFQPLVTMRGGLVGSYLRAEDELGRDVDSQTLGPIVGAGIGGLWWGSSNLAFDTRIMVDYAPLWGTRPDGEVTNVDGYARDSHNVSVSLVTGIAFGPRTKRRESRPRP